MRRVIRNNFRSFEVLKFHERRSANTFVEFRNTFSALAFLRSFLSNSISVMTLRSLLYEMSSSKNVFRLSDHQVLDQIARYLSSGQLRIAELPDSILTWAYQAPIIEEEIAEPAPPLAGEEKKSWIEIELVDEENQPIANEKYLITLPDGKTIKTGTTNAKGRAKIIDIEPGVCQITFPELDKTSPQTAD